MSDFGALDFFASLNTLIHFPKLKMASESRQLRSRGVRVPSKLMEILVHDGYDSRCIDSCVNMRIHLFSGRILN